MALSNEASAAEPRRLGSYTTAKVTRGRVERLEQHVVRLRRDAARLGLPLPDARAIEALFLERARAAFGRDDGILRVEWSHLPGEPPELLARPRAFDPRPAAWRVVTSRAVHPGPEARANTKFVDVPAYDAARSEVAKSDAQEALLFDADGWLVEGSASNILVVTAANELVTPARALGAVEGLGLSVVRHRRADVQEGRIGREALEDARELIAVNGVRGAVPITQVDTSAVGDGSPGPVARAIGAIFRA